MSILLVTDFELSRRHGTGAQVLQIFEGQEFHHLHSWVVYGSGSEIRNSTLLKDSAPGPRGVRGALIRLKRLTGNGWWHGSAVNVRKLAGLIRSLGLQFDVVYVVTGGEGGAARSLSIARAVGLPYVVHVMDIFHPDGLDGSTAPSFRALLEGAAGVISLLPSISTELRKLADIPITDVPIGKPASNWIASAPSDGEPIRIVTGGRPDVGGCHCLAAAWHDLQQLGQRVEVHYVGPHFVDIPAGIRRHFLDAGFISDEDAFRRFLASAHIGLVTGPNTMNQFGRYSFPSRSVDYLMAGLPLIACVPLESATAAVLRPITPGSVAIAIQPSDIPGAVARFAGDRGQWESASQTARTFAINTMGLDAVRGRILDILRSACRSDARLDALNLPVLSASYAVGGR